MTQGSDAAAVHTARTILEERVAGAVPLFEHPEWTRLFPWLFQGVTGRDGDFDLSFFGGTAAGKVQENWKGVREATGFARVSHARQVHGADVLVQGDAAPGTFIAAAGDGHATRTPGILLAVSVADCVPVSIVDARGRGIALLHAGWRGAAAGILEHGVRALLDLTGAAAADLHAHLGPAICGGCYEVGPEVHAAFGLADPGGPAPIDLRAILAARADALGIGNVTMSGHCTRCGGAAAPELPFYSHRGGSAERQMALLGMRHL